MLTPLAAGFSSKFYLEYGLQAAASLGIIHVISNPREIDHHAPMKQHRSSPTNHRISPIGVQKYDSRVLSTKTPRQLEFAQIKLPRVQTPIVKMAICRKLIRPIEATDSEPGALAVPFVPSEGAEELTADSVDATSTTS